MTQDPLPVGKLPSHLLAHLLSQTPIHDPQVLLGPGIGHDCAVVDGGAKLWVIKSDPITFVTDDIGWYVVQINANDIATTGATPRWLMATILLPEQRTTATLAERIHQQIYTACQEINVSLIGGHTEITYGLDRPIVVGTLIGEVARDCLITPRGAKPGDRILLTKSVPIEATAILAREYSEQISQALTSDELTQARGYLYKPGISVLRDAQLANQAGLVSAMHDPTEGGLLAALWELAQASNCQLVIDLEKVPISDLSAHICRVFKIDPLAAIASGALLLTAPQRDAPSICRTLNTSGIPCCEIGDVQSGNATVWSRTALEKEPLPCPSRDAIATVISP
ncbi:AIR synthase family protein [Acaryochloris sp. CCMEE 5410]|uniref:AIR synthase family protein n=1 Tax=Acaryochloris sp. CCMEE 5410 TaxID=310037 RepID=UPI0002484618|nr:AIR synthase family protein [Acaryochloris sp. CCMEE 5410]KAI9129696.1 AIR synthase family protein [Acaryochloris sp. CCMEE 5410]